MSAAPPGAPNNPEAQGRRLSGPTPRLDSMAEWQIEAADLEEAQRLAREAGVSPTLAVLLARRGIRTADAARAYLRPREEPLHDAQRLRGAAEAADLLVSTARRGRRVVVFGDYDVDGVTSVAQLRAALARTGADARAFIPHRLRDGYGLKPDTVRRVLEELSPAAIVTVDCGITAIEGVACARAAAVDVIVTDHHLVPDELPDGAIVVNPRQPGCDYPYKELAACGIALKIAEAIARRAGVALSSESLLRAACLGTIADLVPLTGENRAIAARGLAALASARAPGLRAILAEAGLAPGAAPTAEDVAFRIGPRLNAAGRIDTAELALSLFEEKEGGRAAAIARELSARNAERRELERRVVAQARERIERNPQASGAALIVEADAGWHRGVLGIAASRLAREYHRPVLLFGIEGDRASGSGRSIPGVSLHGLLSEMAHHFTEFGGHDQACGASLPAARLEAFAAEARALFDERIPASVRLRVEAVDAELPLGRLDETLRAELALLEPHGAGNPAPVFLARGVAASAPFLPAGAQGLRGRLRAGERDVRCVAWRPDGHLQRMAASGEAMDILYRVPPDRGDWGLQVEILDAHSAGGRS